MYTSLKPNPGRQALDADVDPDPTQARGKTAKVTKNYRI
jgi:hypothetical protein